MQVVLHTPNELHQSSYARTGLYELEALGRLRTAVRFNCSIYRGTLEFSEQSNWMFNSKMQSKTSLYEFKEEGKSTIKFAIDLYDFENQISTYALDNCDFVFKRNYRSELVKKLPNKYRTKVVPLGLSFRVVSTHEKNQWVYYSGMLCQNIRGVIWDRRFLVRLYAAIKRTNSHWGVSKKNRILETFDEYPVFQMGKTVLFQTRCFEEKNDDIREIHKQRFEVIMALKRNFPETFRGGFVPSPLVKERYSEAITNVPTAPKEYLRAVKETSIVVYTRGVANSPAWKMAEYLSQGKVIMAEPLTTDLPVPLKHREHVMYFRNIDELIANIREVQENRELSQRLSSNARSYFEKHVHPVTNMERILTFMAQSK